MYKTAAEPDGKGDGMMNKTMEKSQYNTVSQLINHTLFFLAAHYITFVVEEVPSTLYI